MRTRKPLTPIQIRQLLLNECRRDDARLAFRIVTVRQKHAHELTPEGLHMLTHCAQSLMVSHG